LLLLGFSGSYSSYSVCRLFLSIVCVHSSRSWNVSNLLGL
jgi:hypothetical protein